MFIFHNAIPLKEVDRKKSLNWLLLYFSFSSLFPLSSRFLRKLQHPFMIISCIIFWFSLPLFWLNWSFKIAIIVQISRWKKALETRVFFVVLRAIASDIQLKQLVAFDKSLFALRLFCVRAQSNIEIVLCLNNILFNCKLNFINKKKKERFNVNREMKDAWIKFISIFIVLNDTKSFTTFQAIVYWFSAVFIYKWIFHGRNWL